MVYPLNVISHAAYLLRDRCADLWQWCSLFSALGLAKELLSMGPIFCLSPPDSKARETPHSSLVGCGPNPRSGWALSPMSIGRHTSHESRSLAGLWTAARLLRILIAISALFACLAHSCEREAGMLRWAYTLGRYRLVSTRSWLLLIFSNVCGITTSNPDAIMYVHMLQRPSYAWGHRRG